jgi:hypothetical protein
MEVHYLCWGKRWMNGWVCTESVNMYLPSVVAQSCWEVLGEEKTNKKDMWKEEFMKKGEERSKRRVWKFQGDHKEETHQYDKIHIVNWKCKVEQYNNLWIKQYHIHLATLIRLNFLLHSHICNFLRLVNFLSKSSNQSQKKIIYMQSKFQNIIQ